MNRINEFNTEPGTYADQHGTVVVVVDVVNYSHNVDQNLPEALPDPLVIARDVVAPPKEHRRYSYPMSFFKSNFSKQ